MYMCVPVWYCARATCDVQLFFRPKNNNKTHFKIKRLFVGKKIDVAHVRENANTFFLSLIILNTN